MPLQSQDSPLGAFLKALRQECILVGAMAAIEQGAPLMTVATGPIQVLYLLCTFRDCQ